MAGDIYSVNPKNIVGGPGRIVVKPFDGNYPDTIAEVMATNPPHDLTAGWNDVGATNDGITISRGFDTEDFSVDQVSGAIDTDITEWTHTLETNLAENTPENRKFALVGSEIIETPAVLGTATTLTAATAAGATILNVGDATGFVEGGYLQVGEDVKKIARIQGTSIYITQAAATAYDAATAVTAITELGTRRIGYGAVNDVPYYTIALISKRKDDTLYMAVFRKCKVTGDDKEQTFGAEKRLLPLSLAAYPDGDAPQNENVYYEIEQMV